jgi:DNA invertase Pin-like site-specific DNA recombinase
MPVKRGSATHNAGDVFGRSRKQPKMLRAGLYARVSTNDQQTLPMQSRAMREYAVGFVSLTEALDLTTPAGRAMAGLLAIFAEFEREILRERTRAGLAHARQNGKRLGRPATAAAHAAEIRKLHRAGISKSEIARRLEIGRTSVRRILGALR